MLKAWITHDPEGTPLTPEERAWILRLQRVLGSCPSSRLAAATTGGPSLTIYDIDREQANPVDSQKDIDFLPALARRNEILAVVHCTPTFTIASTAG